MNDVIVSLFLCTIVTTIAELADQIIPKVPKKGIVLRNDREFDNCENRYKHNVVILVVV